LRLLQKEEIMPRLDSPEWNLGTGVCEKHGIPQIPCPQCLATQDVDISVYLTPEDVQIMEMDASVQSKDLLPTGQEWLLSRVVPPPSGAY
jgi:hypothetical protein